MALNEAIGRATKHFAQLRVLQLACEVRHSTTARVGNAYLPNLAGVLGLKESKPQPLTDQTEGGFAQVVGTMATKISYGIPRNCAKPSLFLKQLTKKKATILRRSLMGINRV